MNGIGDMHFCHHLSSQTFQKLNNIIIVFTKKASFFDGKLLPQINITKIPSHDWVPLSQLTKSCSCYRRLTDTKLRPGQWQWDLIILSLVSVASLSVFYWRVLYTSIMTGHVELLHCSYWLCIHTDLYIVSKIRDTKIQHLDSTITTCTAACKDLIVIHRKHHLWCLWTQYFILVPLLPRKSDL